MGIACLIDEAIVQTHFSGAVVEGKAAFDGDIFLRLRRAREPGKGESIAGIEESSQTRKAAENPKYPERSFFESVGERGLGEKVF